MHYEVHAEQSYAIFPKRDARIGSLDKREGSPSLVTKRVDAQIEYDHSVYWKGTSPGFWKGLFFSGVEVPQYLLFSSEGRSLRGSPGDAEGQSQNSGILDASKKVLDEPPVLGRKPG